MISVKEKQAFAEGLSPSAVMELVETVTPAVYHDILLLRFGPDFTIHADDLLGCFRVTESQGWSAATAAALTSKGIHRMATRTEARMMMDLHTPFFDQLQPYGTPWKAGDIYANR